MVNEKLDLKEVDGESLRRLGHPAAPQGGIACEKCGCKHWFTKRTLGKEGEVRRYKTCRNCGKKTRTVERPG